MSLDALPRRVPSIDSLRAPLIATAAGAVLLVGAAITSRVWLPAFIVVGLALVALLAYAALLWPRVVLVLLVLSPILDRYIVSGILPPTLGPITNLLSEGLLLGVAVIMGVRAWRDGTLVAAFRHPTTVALSAFVALAVVATVVNGVPVQVAAAGLVFTIDAALLFFLPRMVGFTLREAVLAMGAVVGLVVVASFIALAQALLSPTLLGLSPVAGRFGEVYRLASVLDDPNVFGAFLVGATPFLLLAARRLPERRERWMAGALAFLVVLALWLTFSRGSWLALIAGVGVTLALIDRRALLLGIATVVVSFAVAVAMPRDLLVPTTGAGSELRGERPELIGSTLDRVDTIGRGEDLRILFVLNAMPILRDHPLIGVGPGRYGGTVANTFPTPIYPQYETDELFIDPTQRTVDNFWLHILVELGVLGFVALLAAALIPGIRILIAAAGGQGWRRILLGGIAAGSAGLALSSVTTMLLEANSVAYLFWFMLGVGTLVVHQREVPPEPAAVPLNSDG